MRKILGKVPGLKVMLVEHSVDNNVYKVAIQIQYIKTVHQNSSESTEKAIQNEVITDRPTDQPI